MENRFLKKPIGRRFFLARCLGVTVGLAGVGLFGPGTAIAELLTKGGLSGRDDYMIRVLDLSKRLATLDLSDDRSSRQARDLVATLRSALQDMRFSEGSRAGKVGPPVPLGVVDGETKINPDPATPGEPLSLSQVPIAWFQLQVALALEDLQALATVLEEGSGQDDTLLRTLIGSAHNRITLINRPPADLL